MLKHMRQSILQTNVAGPLKLSGKNFYFFFKKVLDQLLSICYNRYCSDERAQKELLLRDGVMVAQVTLDHSVWVRVLVPEPNGAMVKRLRRRPLKAKSRVRFPLALPMRLTLMLMHQRFLLFKSRKIKPNEFISFFVTH